MSATPSRTVPVVAGAVLAVALVAALLVYLGARGSDEDAAPTGGSPTTQAPESPSEEPTTDPAEPTEPTDPAEPTQPAELPAAVTAAADQAARDGFPVFVPDRLREGWLVTDASYDPRARAWELTVTTDAGPVRVHQQEGRIEGLVRAHARGLRAGPDVDLDDVQLGTWSSWVGSDAAAVGTTLPIAALLVAGPDVEAATDVARSLLTYESVGGGEQD